MTDNRRNNRKYTQEEKEKFVSRMLPPENYSISKLSQETGISKSTLSTWKTKAISGTVSKKQGRPSKGLCPREKFLAVMESYTMPEIELSKYCRENGYYVEDIKAWRASCIAANELQKEDSKELREKLNKEKKKAKVLEKEIRIKDKALADKGVYIASESTIYRILKKENMQCHRGRCKVPTKKNHPTTFVADGPNQVWTWDITYFNTFTRGIYYKLYMIIDIYSRKIVGAEVWPEETGELAAELVERAILSENIRNKPLVLHSDNGAPMKSYTLKAKLEVLGVLSSYSRPRVSNDNPFSEAQFRTLKYRSNFLKI